MDNVDELPSWAARTHVPADELPVQEPPPEKRRSFRPVLFGLLGLLALGGMAAVGYWAATLTDDDNTSTSDGTESSLMSEADTSDATTDGATSAGADGADESTVTTATETEDATDNPRRRCGRC